MAKGKLSPRQKMINLMYLIFIAMLALNVDREVLRSFEGINNSLESSTGLTAENNALFYDQVVKKAQADADYVETKNKALELKGITDEFVGYIGGIKDQLKKEGEYGTGEDGETNYNALQNTEPIVDVFFRKQGGGVDDTNGNQLAQGFIQKLNDFKQNLVKYGGSQTRVDQLFNTEKSENAGKKKTWLAEKFYEQPMVAALTSLSKMQADARTEEGNIVRNMLSGKIEQKLEFNQTAVLVSVPQIIQKGQQQNAFVAIGAYSGEASGSISVNGKSYSLREGKATIPLATTPGNYNFSGTVSYKLPNGKTESGRFNESYKVVSETIQDTPTGGAISADKMNVVYIGVDNPMSASLNGVDGGISMNASSGSLSGSNGKYNYRPASGAKSVTFTASGKTSTGKSVSVKQDFRVKPVPPARGIVRGKTSEVMPASSLSKQTVNVDWPGFEFPVTGTVTSFKLKVPGQLTKVVSGNRLSGAGSVLDKAKKGDAVNIFDIKYTDNTGTGGGRATPVAIEIR